SELRQARRQNLALGVVSLLVAGAFMLAVAAISSRALARAQQRLLLARDQADAASRAKGELLAREEEQRRRLDLLMRCANIGSFDWDVQRSQASYSPRLKEMLGYPEDADTSRWRVEEFIHPDDREAVISRSLSLMKASAAAGTVSHSEPYDFRLTGRDGRTLSVHGDAIA
ncbi:MAG: PAS domain-containing protein, partial [Pseudomonadota bacterium]